MRPRRRVEPTRPVIPHSRINEDIRVQQVRLVGEDGAQLGVKPIKEAAQKKIAAALAEVESGGPLYAEAVAKFKADPLYSKILDWDRKR